MRCKALLKRSLGLFNENQVVYKVDLQSLY